MTVHRSLRTDLVQAYAVKGLGNRYRSRIARTGVQHYDDHAEYRPMEEVFSDASLATLRGVPVTLGHPERPVAGRIAGRTDVIGFVETDAPFRRLSDPDAHAHAHATKGHHPSDELLEATLVITDAALRARLDSGETVELSAGYSCELEPANGRTRDGRPYQFIQRNIVFDHVAALLPAQGQAARCGPACRVHIDQSPQERFPSSVSSCSCPVQTDSFNDPRFPGKSRVYVETYLAECATRGLPAPEHTDAQQAREDARRATARVDVVHVPGARAVDKDDAAYKTDAQVYAEFEARMRKVYTDAQKFGNLDGIGGAARADTDHADTDHADTDHADTDHADTVNSASFSAHLARRAHQMYGSGE